MTLVHLETGVIISSLLQLHHPEFFSWFFSQAYSQMYGIHKPPLLTCCSGDLQCFGFVFEGWCFIRDVLFQNFRIFIFWEMFCLPLLIHNLKIFSGMETYLIFRRGFCFFGLQLKNVGLIFWARNIIEYKTENFLYKFSLIRGGRYSSCQWSNICHLEILQNNELNFCFPRS